MKYCDKCRLQNDPDYLENNVGQQMFGFLAPLFFGIIITVNSLQLEKSGSDIVFMVFFVDAFLNLYDACENRQKKILSIQEQESSENKDVTDEQIKNYLKQKNIIPLPENQIQVQEIHNESGLIQNETEEDQGPQNLQSNIKTVTMVPFQQNQISLAKKTNNTTQNTLGVQHYDTQQSAMSAVGDQSAEIDEEQFTNPTQQSLDPIKESNFAFNKIDEKPWRAISTLINEKGHYEGPLTGNPLEAF